MRVLILSCNTGQGHNTAALAIKEAFEKNGHSCEIQNTLLFLSKIHDTLISDGHVFVYKRLPKLFGIGYRYEENHEPKFIQAQLRLGVKKFEKFLKGNNFDVIICTHVFSSILVNEYKKKTGFDCPCAFVSTDYTCHPGAFESDADLYFIPHPALTDEFVSAGVDRAKIYPLGIPISQKFLLNTSKKEAREALNLPLDKKIVLIGGGSMGCGPIVKLSDLISQKLCDDGLVIVACGNNKQLLERITKLKSPNLLPLPYTKRMDLYLDAADLYLSKAGGLSTTEAVFKRVALLYIASVPGCESRNIDFMTSQGYADSADTPEDAVALAASILKDPLKACERISGCRAQLPDDPAQAICQEVTGYVLKKEAVNVKKTPHVR
ncbi:MAG: glycosyltransferase [Oscillospiraceae bacterium]|nr:glycosyltransferase [Oscillospiraceae bacterium]